jgi:hypothetical protein
MTTNPIKEAPKPEYGAYVTWDKDNPESAKSAFNEVAKAYQTSLSIGKAAQTRTNQNFLPNISIRDGFTRDDYEYFHPREMSPRTYRQAMMACQKAYDEVGLIRRIVDFMGDFACGGIKIVHKDKKTEDFYKEWWKKVNGKDRSERFLNTLYRIGNVVIQRQTGKMKRKDARDLQKGLARSDIKFERTPELKPMEIPLSYWIHETPTVEVIKPDLAKFARKKFYGLRVGDRTIDSFKLDKNATDIEKQIYESIPLYLRETKVERDQLIVLPPDKTSVYHYKKDDYMLWALPMMYPILVDIALLQKLKLTDIAACDDAIKRVRLWKIGSLEHQILPSQEMVAALDQMILNAGEGAIDIIWGPELTLDQSKSDIHQYLGSEKYNPALTAIYQGFGIPPALAGGSTGSSMSYNFVTIKVLIESLIYGRDKLMEFWNQEVKLVQKAMGHSDPPQFIFDIMDLTSDAAITKMLMDLSDRDIISSDSLLEHFGRNPEIEEARIRRDLPNRKEIPKVSPYHDADPNFSLKKIFAQSGTVTPSELGVELEPKKPGEKTALDLKEKKLASKQSSKPKGTPGQGRPKNAGDSKPRKTRVAKAGEIETLLWARKAYEAIGDILQPAILNKLGKANLRQLTTEEAITLEDLKFGVLSNIEEGSKITKDIVSKAFSEPFSSLGALKTIQRQLIEDAGPNVNVDDLRYLSCLAYTIARSDS